MRTSNPVLNDSVFQRDATASTTMTLGGTVLKTAILLVVMVGAGVYTWQQAMAEHNVAPFMIGGILVGAISAFAIAFFPKFAPYVAPVYAVAEGLALGGISAQFETSYPGIAFQAFGMTAGTLGALLAAYMSGLVRATENFKLGVVAATGGIAIFYIVNLVLSFFGVRIPGVFDSGMIGIGFSLFVVIVAALNLVLDFDFIENGAKAGAPKYMEWYGAFGLLVTLVWLYVEFLRLLSKLRSRD